jgi:hypothetical protein
MGIYFFLITLDPKAAEKAGAVPLAPIFTAKNAPTIKGIINPISFMINCPEWGIFASIIFL